MVKKIGNKAQQLLHTDNVMVKYILVAALAALLGFSIFYMYNVHMAGKEAFSDGADGSEGNSSAAAFRVVYIYSNSCGHCTQFTPTFNTFAQMESTNPKIQVVSFEKSMPAAEPYMSYVSAFPTILIFSKDNKLVNSKTGNLPLSTLQEFVSSSTK